MGEIFAGRYELVDPIGRGGVGAVWRVWDHRRRRYVAAKVLQQRDAHTLLRFVREQALRIDHPHVLAPASWAADDDKVLFTMDLVGGGSFAHLIGDYGPLLPRYVCTLIDQLLSGLAAVHAEGVVHRDIKPANILLESTGTGRPHVRLSDFGIALTKGEPRLTEANYVMGTPGYFAPEQMMGDDPDFPADLFAVGLVALYLITGHKPDGEALVKLFEQGVPNAPTGVPEPLWQVIAGLLQPDPENRFRTATGARKALATAVDLLPEADLDDDAIEVFDQLGPLPTGFGPEGPTRPRRRHAKADPPRDNGAAPSRPQSAADSGPADEAAPGPDAAALQQPAAPRPSMSDTGSFTLPPPLPRNDQSHTPHTEAPGAPGTPSSGAPPAEVRHPEPPHAQTPPNRTPPHHQTPPPQPAGPPTPTPPPPTAQPATPPPPVQRPSIPHPLAPPTPSTAAPIPPAPQPPVHHPHHAQQQPPHPVQPVQHPHPHTPTPAPAPAPNAAHTPTPTPTPTPLPRDFPSTRPYTAERPRVPSTARRRPGPSRKATLSILIVAALCFAIGAWALVAAG
ncbi:serine/threonine-protein kinase [Streptomyces rhizosphaericus]|uniref:non-specific serine/threonine protein kinase n=1 Tax=Streptomyces rhizosphaericus TaxID=114699 RepID=A0ABP4D2I9_9ACTN|nr:serine/threonine-protein kinase [Streptomyces indonesiensis]